jgi:hypothetical protein
MNYVGVCYSKIKQELLALLCLRGKTPQQKGFFGGMFEVMKKRQFLQH